MEVMSLEFTIPCAECPDCGGEIDPAECQVIVILVCPHCHTNSAYGEQDEKLH